MNNTQFRRLVLDTPIAARQNESRDGVKPRGGGATPALGSRMRSSIPMTPRSVAGSSGNDFARQLAERNAELNPSNVKKFRSSRAPKGTKLRLGYQDRTQLRTSGEEDDKAVRVKALEDMVKLGQMDPPTFEALRDEIIGGDVKDVHLVKGLDFKLLERVRRGENVLSDTGKPGQPDTPEEDQPLQPEIDVDHEFEKLEEKGVQPFNKEKTLKRGEMAPPPAAAGKKRTRDDILKELKASRLAAAEKAKQSVLGPRFVKVGQRKETSRIEKDGRGRKVLITVDAEGKVKRKVKKAELDDSLGPGHGLLMPEKGAKPLGMEVVPVVPPSLEEDNGDIFEDVGTDYNPFGDGADDDDLDDSDHGGKPSHEVEPLKASPPPKASETDTSNMPPPQIPRKRNYFGDSEVDKNSVDGTPRNPLTDPAILAALRKASTINPIAIESTNEDEAAKLARRKRMLESDDRDAEDMDMEFGSSRFGDQEDGEDSSVKLSVWGGDGEEEDANGEGKGKRKRGAKKRKGNVNSAADVLKVMERRKGDGK